MLPQKLAFVDVETTGVSTRFDRVIEIGILRMENDKEVAKFSSLLNPQTFLPPEITRITGIKAQDLENAPSFSDIEETVLELLNGCVFVAHNVRFDYGFLRHEFKRIGKTFTTKHFCTVRLAKMLFPTLIRHNLDTLISHFNLPCPNRHRALDDARVLWYFCQKAKETVDEKLLNASIITALRQPSLPPHLEKSTIEELSEGPGVYILYGDNELPLYIGKSKCIQERVKTHFLSDINDSKEMKIAQQVKRIEVRETAGELGALFLESRLIKEMLPLYNKKLRQSRKILLLRKFCKPDGYYKLKQEHFVNGEALDDFANVVRIYKSEKEAKNSLHTLAKEHNLCLKLLCLENTKSECFYYRLGFCKGACIKKEDPLRYNLRFLMALSQRAIRPWPFQGPVVITESNEEGLTEHFIINKWCFLGNVVSQAEDDLNISQNDLGFDLDAYRILFRFLSTEKNIRQVKKADEGIMARLTQQ